MGSENSEKIVVTVDGEVGAGKTTAIQAIYEYLTSLGYKVCVTFEPVDIWESIGILQKFYEDPDKWCYPFQTFTVVSRLIKICEAYETNPDADVYIIERSPFTDRYVFVESLRERMEDTLLTMYDIWWKEWFRLMPFRITKSVYLKPSLEECMKRVEKRHRRGETEKKASEREDMAKGGVSIEYQARLRKFHEEFFENRKDMPVAIVSGDLANNDFSVPSESRDELTKFIHDFIMGDSTTASSATTGNPLSA